MWLTNSFESPTERREREVVAVDEVAAAASQRHSRRALSTTLSSTASGSEEDRPRAVSTSFIAANCSVASV